jgi:hypothetical protein
MRTSLLLPAAIVFLLLGDQWACAQSRTGVECTDSVGFVPNGITHREAHTSAGQPCQMGFGMMGGNIEELQIVVRPGHGVLGVSKKEENRRYIAYVPQAGYVGRDRFEVFVRFTPLGHDMTYTTRMKVEMNVTP